MSSVSSDLVVYIPLMHEELLPPGLPEGLSLFCPGCSGMPGSSSVKGQKQWRPDMPYSSKEVRACLADMEMLGWDMLSGNPVQTMAASFLPSKKVFTQEEARALKGFSKNVSGITSKQNEAAFSHELFSTDVESSVSTISHSARCRAQRLLLLAWLQEERVRDMEVLLEKCQSCATTLNETMGTDERFTRLGLEADPRRFLPDWRFVLEQMALFLPENASLFTGDPRLLAEMKADCDNATFEVDTDRLFPQWDRSILQRLHVVRLPLWHFLGLTGPQQGKPWLDATHFILMYD